MSLISSLSTLLLTVWARAAETGHNAHSNEIPGTVKWQVINLAILAVILYKYGKQPIKDFFLARQTDYLKQAEKSKAIFQEAEKEYADVKKRLEDLNSTAESSVERAKKDAQDQKKQIVAEAQVAATKVKDEAQNNAKLESQRATLKVKNDIVLQALANARQMLTTDIAGQDHQKLQADFSKNIEAVNS